VPGLIIGLVRGFGVEIRKGLDIGKFLPFISMLTEIV
jgi:hypothetical protein